MLDDSFSGGKQDAVKIVFLTIGLQLDDNQLAFAVESQQIDPIELSASEFLVAFRFQNLLNFDVFFEQFGQETFQNIKRGRPCGLIFAEGAFSWPNRIG